MNTPDELRHAVCSLLAEGKKPSVAHLKAKLGSRTPLPVIINLLHQYQAAPEKYKAAEATPDGRADARISTSPADAAETSENSRQPSLTDIHSELVQIRQLLEKLTDR